MDKLLKTLHATNGIKTFFYKIFNGFHVVVRRLLNLLNPASISLAEILINLTQTAKKRSIKVFQLRQRQFAQGNEIFNFHTDTVAHQCVF